MSEPVSEDHMLAQGLLGEDEAGLIGLADTPAYLRRAMRVDEATRQIDRRCQELREKIAGEIRLRLKTWNKLVADRPNLAARLSPATLAALAAIEEAVFIGAEPRTLRDRIPWPVLPHRIWRNLAGAVAAYNLKWNAGLAAIDLGPLGKEIAGYNKHYLFEKECAFRSARIARIGFTPMAPVDAGWLAARWSALPPLPESMG
ncbi:MAG TPA: hypothetical protein VNC50_17925 [Planctomycetia bacterium]|nr:hypothetical protein [Planctomycetia bacterium]